MVRCRCRGRGKNNDWVRVKVMVNSIVRVVVGRSTGVIYGDSLLAEWHSAGGDMSIEVC